MDAKVFSIGENHDDDKRHEKQCGKNELTCGKHSDNILHKFKQLYAEVINLQRQLIHKNHAQTTSCRQGISYRFCDRI